VTGTGTDQALPVDPSGSVLFQPLAPGSYSVAIDDIASQCQITSTGGSTKTVTVTDQGLPTRASIGFDLKCPAPGPRRLSVRTVVDGDTTDANGFSLNLSGVAADATLPASERAVSIDRTIPGISATTVFEDVRPGTYSLLIQGVSPLCALTGTAQRDGI